ncbi:MAG: hypothetical protein ABW136_02825 [Steroidobacteraceae bacterium]
MSAILWTIVALDAALFAGLLVKLLAQRGINDGGRERGIAFFIVTREIR